MLFVFVLPEELRSYFCVVEICFCLKHYGVCSWGRDILLPEALQSVFFV